MKKQSFVNRLGKAGMTLLFGLSVALVGVLWAGSVPIPARASPEMPPAPPLTHLASFNPLSPTTPVRLIFIHHSTGENWLADDNGGLGKALRNNNYFVSDTNYGWGPPDYEKGYEQIGDHTDIPDWYSWFTGPHRDTYLAALYAEAGQHSSYSRLATNPGGENKIIMFKSCFPNSALEGNPGDPPASSANYNSDLTVANAKRIYLDLLNYFAPRQDKLFIVITAPPLASGATNASQAANARAFNNWLVNDWLDNYPYRNVAVFNFYNVLTSNGGNSNTNDLGWTDGNHHRWWNGTIQHIQTVSNNYSAYPTSDSHPSQAGNLKATGEFVPLLNVFYNRWREGASQKSASNSIPQQSEAFTYTIVIRGLDAPLTITVYLTDVVRAGLAYVPGTLTATTGLVTETVPTLTWSGLLTPTPAVTVTYVVTVATDTRRVIINNAVIAAPGYETLTRTATVYANGVASYLPVIMKQR